MASEDDPTSQPDERHRARKSSAPTTEIDVTIHVDEAKDQASVTGLSVGQIGQADIRSGHPTTIHHAEQVIIEAGGAAAPPEPGDPPYKGLDFYDVADAPLFFGREQLTAELVAFVRQHSFMAIVGASGSGKSSLARAGLIAALQSRIGRPLEDGVQPPLGSRDWRYVPVTPTAHPFEALARALAGEGADGKALMDALHADQLALRDRAAELAGAGGRLLLLVDQFEESFTLCKDEAERIAYVDALLAASGEPAFGSATTHCTVVLTLRADFYAPCLRHEKLRTALKTQQKPIGAMNRTELQRTIELPAQAGLWAFQQGLVEQILDDVGDEPGKLPLLSYALLETWKRRSGRVMTLAGYQAAGGVEKAISQTADRVLDDLTRQGRGDVARRILLSLVEPGDAGRATRRRELLRDLVSEEAESPEAKTLMALSARDARLVTVDGEVVQISHEALITAWPRLGEWLRIYRDDLQLLDSLREAAAAWSAAEPVAKQDLLAHRGGRLDDAITLRDGGEFTLGERERAYLAACLALRDQELATERKRQRDRFRLIAGAAIVALVLAVFAFRQTKLAQTQAFVARTSELAADAQAVAEKEPQLSLLLASEAVTRSQTLDPGRRIVKAEQALLDGLSTVGGLPLVGHTGQIGRLVFSKDGKWLASGSAWDGTAHLWNLNKARLQEQAIGAETSSVQTLLADDPIDAKLEFSRDSRWLTVYGSGNDSAVRLWDLQADEPQPLSPKLDGATNAAAFSPDSCRLATGDTFGTIRVWNLCQESPTTDPLTWAGHALTITVAVYSPDGRWLVTGDKGQTLKLWDMRLQQPASSPIMLDNHISHQIDTFEFSPDSGWPLASGWGLGGAALWRIADLQDSTESTHIVPVLEGDTGTRSALSGDGRWLVTAHNISGNQNKSGRFEVALYPLRPEGGRPEPRKCNFSGFPRDLVVSRDGRWVVVTTEDGRMLLLETDSEAVCDSRTLTAPGTSGTSVIISEDSRWLAAWTDRQRIAYVWQLPLTSDGADPIVLNAHDGSITAARFSADSRWLVTGASDGGMRLWDLTSATPTTVIPLTFVKGNGSCFYGCKSITTEDAKWVVSPYSQKGTQGLAFWEISSQASGAPAILCPSSSWAPDFTFDASTGLLVAWDIDSGLDLFDVDTARRICTRRAHLDPNEGLSLDTSPVGLSPDGRWLITQDIQSQSFELRDPAADLATESIPCVGDSPGAGDLADGHYLLSVDSAAWHRLTWGHNRSGGLWCHDQLLEQVNQVVSSANGKWAAAVVERNGTVEAEIWNLEGSEQRVVERVTSSDSPSPVAIDNSGHWLAEPKGEAIGLWHLAFEGSAPISYTLPLRDLFVNVAFSQNSHWVAASSKDGSIQLWNLTGESPSLPLVYWMDPASSTWFNNTELAPTAMGLYFSADTQWLIGVSQSAVKLWPISMNTLLKLSCSTAGRNLTQKELKQYLPDAPDSLICPNLPAGE